MVSRVNEKQATPTLAGKLDRLFRASGRGAAGPRGREPSYQQVAAAIEAAGGPTISATYVWQLRRGDRDNPTKAHLEALAAYFAIPVAYFFADEGAEQELVADAELRAAVQSEGVRRLAVRAADLPAESLDSVLQIVEVMRGVHGLPTAAADGTPAAQSKRASRRAVGPRAR